MWDKDVNTLWMLRGLSMLQMNHTQHKLWPRFKAEIEDNVHSGRPVVLISTHSSAVTLLHIHVVNLTQDGHFKLQPSSLFLSLTSCFHCGEVPEQSLHMVLTGPTEASHQTRQHEWYNHLLFLLLPYCWVQMGCFKRVRTSHCSPCALSSLNMLDIWNTSQNLQSALASTDSST